MVVDLVFTDLGISRRFWRCFPGPGQANRKFVCHEAGECACWNEGTSFTYNAQLRKADMLRKGQEGHVRAERDILKSAALVHRPGGAEWIVRLYYSFQDRDHLYLVSRHIPKAAVDFF